MGKESATSTNTGTLRLDNQLALALAGASQSAGLVAQKSPQATAAAGTTVAGGILIVATSVVVSPVGKFRIDFWASWFTTTPGVVTPTMRIRSGLTFFEVEAYAQQTVEGPYRIGGTIEMDRARSRAGMERAAAHDGRRPNDHARTRRRRRRRGHSDPGVQQLEGHMESSTSTNSGFKRLDNQAALALAGRARATLILALLQNRNQGTTISGTTVAAGDAIASTTLTPKYTGKVRISWTGTWQAPGAGVVTPVLLVGPSPVGPFVIEVAFAQTGTVVGGEGGSFEVDGLTIGTEYIFSLSTSVGDATITIGQAALATGASILAEEVP